MIVIDGSKGEGGGQVLRTALSLSLATSTPFRIERIRAGRGRPGLLRQHLAAVRAAATLGEAEVEGGELGSSALVFRPRRLRGGRFTFSVGSAGSATLVLQTVLPALLAAPEPSEVVLEGGTHNPLAPPWEMLERSFFPLVARAGGGLEARLEVRGFAPHGGGRIHLRVSPSRLGAVELLERGALRARVVRVVQAQVPEHVARRELDTVTRALGWTDADARVDAGVPAGGPGNVVLAWVEHDHVTEVAAGFGERGTRAETVAAGVAAELARYLASRAPVGEHLADQLVVPLLLGAGGRYRTLAPSGHLLTQAATTESFFGPRMSLSEVEPAVFEVRVEPLAR